MNLEVGEVGKSLKKRGRCRSEIGDCGRIVAVVLPIIGGEKGKP